MTPEERQMISGLFDRMRSYGSPEKDREADALIAQSVRSTPDATYMLVQSVLVQENALEAAQQRTLELEARVEELEARRPEPSSSGSFLGGMFGRQQRTPDRPPARMESSVPPIGGPTPQSGGVWGQSAPPGGQPWAQQQPQARGGGGGFLKSAMATAAGVAGGMLVADSIRNMMGGHSGSAQAASHQSASDTGSGRSSTQDQPHYQDAADNDPGTYNAPEEANYDDSSGGDWGGGDIET